MISGFAGDPAKNKFLCQVGGRSLPGVDKKIPEEKPEATIRRRIVGIGDSSRAQIATDSRVVRLPLSVVSAADEWAVVCVERAGLTCARSVVKVARVLMQKRRQDGAADHDVGKAVG